MHALSKKNLLIGAGAVLAFLLIGAWVYLFIHGTPKGGSSLFTRFGLGGTASDGTFEGAPAVDVKPVNADGERERLKQLTTRPVAGAAFTPTSIEYVEQGTGHIYSINLGTGEEKLESGTTVAGAESATFSPDGAYVAITSLANGDPATVVGLVDGLSGKLDGVSLPPDARDIAFGSATSTVYYLLKNQNGSSGYAYDMDKGKGVELFRIPLRDVRALWGTPTYVYTTPTAHQKGFVYRVSSSTLEYVRDGEAGLTALSYRDGVVTTYAKSGQVASVAIGGSTETPLPSPLIPEKCATNDALPDVFYCGVPATLSADEFPDAWYMGIISYSDSLYRIDAEMGTADLVSDMRAESGREVDISKIGLSESGTKAYFINKNDNTLWMYDLGTDSSAAGESTGTEATSSASL